MPVPTETLWNIRKVSIVFAFSSVAMLGSLIWMIKVDYARPWRTVQNQYTDLQASLARFEVLGLETQASREALQNAQHAVDAAKKALAAQQELATRLADAFRDAAQRANVAAEVVVQFAGPQRQAYELRARMLGADFARVISNLAARPDPTALLEASQDPAFAEQVVSLLEWFDLAKLRKLVDGIRGEHARTNIEQKNLKSELKVAQTMYEHEKGLFGDEDPKSRHALAELRRIEQAYAAAKLSYDKLADLIGAVEAQQKLLQTDVVQAERSLARINKERDDITRKYAEYSDKISRGLFNMPLNDFLAPKGTRGRNEIKQVVLPDVRVELNFLQSYAVDRCMTCHVGIADKSFSKENLSRQLEKAIFAINEKLGREGKRLLTPPLVTEREDLQAGSIAAAWHTLTREQQERFFQSLVAEVNKFQAMEGEPELKFEQPLLAHPDLDLYVSPQSPHSMNAMGCTVCHEGNGEETDFVLASHTPKSYEERKEWEKKHYVRTGWLVPEQNFDTADHHWDRPMLVPKNSEAGCTKCHAKATDIAMHEGQATARTINQGQFLFTTLGCINCHLVGDLDGSRKVGPDLSHVGEKLTPGFMHNWIWFPKDYRPSTWMPHYFEQENNDAHSNKAGGDRDPVLRTRAEVVAMTEYLLAVSNDYKKETPPAELWNDELQQEGSEAFAAAADRGRRLFGSVGCMACHSALAYRPTTEEGKAGEPLGATWISGDIYNKLLGLVQDVQRGRARQLKKGITTPEVTLKSITDIGELLAVSADEDPGKGLPLLKIQALFDASRRVGRFDVDAARTAAFKEILKSSPDQLRAVTLAAEEEELLVVADEILDKVYEFAVSKYEGMTYVDRVEYAMTNFKDAYDTLQNPQSIKGPVFTRFAPELSSVRTKFESYDKAVNWLYDWLKNPRHYSSYTKMPQMRLKRYQAAVHDLETGETKEEKVDADEALDLAVYLSTLAENKEFSTVRFDAQDEDRKALGGMRDELILDLLGGLNSRARSEAILRDEGGEMSAQLAGKLSGSLGESEAHRRIDSMPLDQRQWVFLGDKVLGHYGCYACHQVRGYENATRPGTELSAWGEKLRAQLDFGFFVHEFEAERNKDPLFRNLYPFDETDPSNPGNREKLVRWAHDDNPHAEPAHTLASFAWHKLRNPRMWDRKKDKPPYEKLRMPNFFLTSEQTDALVTFLLSRKPARVNKGIQVDYRNTPAGRVADGRSLAWEMNCIGCHKIDGNAAVIDQFIQMNDGGRMVFDEINAPPWLRGEGAKVQGAWLYEFFNDVQPLRPWLKVRMPSFHLTNRQATALVEYFVGLSQSESKWLTKRLTPIEKYIADAHQAVGVETQSPPTEEKPAPGADWHTQELLARDAHLLQRYSVDNRLVRASDVDPTQGATPESIPTAYAEILGNARYLKSLYEVTFPYTENSRYLPEEHIADGETLFYSLGCLACHVFGDPSLPGANANPTAPNLQLTHARLRREWVKAWLDLPRRLQPGTKMPELFGAGSQVSAFKDYSDEQKQAIAEKLHDKTLIDDGPAQMQAVTDFLYAAGRAMQNKISPEAAQAAGSVEEGAANGETPATEESPPDQSAAKGEQAVEKEADKPETEPTPATAEPVVSQETATGEDSATQPEEQPPAEPETPSSDPAAGEQQNANDGGAASADDAPVGTQPSSTE